MNIIIQRASLEAHLATVISVLHEMITTCSFQMAIFTSSKIHKTYSANSLYNKETVGNNDHTELSLPHASSINCSRYLQ